MALLDEEAQARADVWNYAFGFINTRVVKCAVELQIPDILENHSGPISLSDLSSAVGCPPQSLHRIMRFLIHRRIFKTTQPPETTAGGGVYYGQTPLSRLMTRDNMAPFMLLHGNPPSGITPEALRTGQRPDLKSVNGEDTWTDPAFGNHKKLFTDAMARHARVAVTAMVENYPTAFEGIGSLVDVGGRHGMAVSMVVKAFRWIRGIAFDLPEIVAHAPPLDGVLFVGGSMFDSVPQADAIMLMVH